MSRTRRSLGVLLFLLMLPALMPLPAQAADPATQIVSATAPRVFAPVAMVIDPAEAVVLVNWDFDEHDVVAASAFRPDGSAEWCAGLPSGECPLFWSELVSSNIDAGTGQVRLPARTPVLGLQDAAPGSYDFTCSVHPYMFGTLVVGPAHT